MTEWKYGEIYDVTIRSLYFNRDERGWLAEVFRYDELNAEIFPVMGYISVTYPGQTRGPHSHAEQTDYFVFAGPGNFGFFMWDARKNSKTFGIKKIFIAGESNPVVVIVPPGIVHGYVNIGKTDAWVMNFPNRLFKGHGRKFPVDEIRYEEISNTEFFIDPAEITALF